jgi:hypothetical protein
MDFVCKIEVAYRSIYCILVPTSTYEGLMNVSFHGVGISGILDFGEGLDLNFLIRCLTAPNRMFVRETGPRL